MRRQDRQYAMKVSVLAYSELTALPPALFLFRSLPRQAPQGDSPERFKELALPRLASAGGAARCRCCCCRTRPGAGHPTLVGLVPVICPAVLLITFARGRASIVGISVGGALHAALQASPEVSEDLDGEQDALH